MRLRLLCAFATIVVVQISLSSAIDPRCSLDARAVVRLRRRGRSCGHRLLRRNRQTAFVYSQEAGCARLTTCPRSGRLSTRLFADEEECKSTCAEGQKENPCNLVDCRDGHICELNRKGEAKCIPSGKCSGPIVNCFRFPCDQIGKDACPAAECQATCNCQAYYLDEDKNIVQPGTPACQKKSQDEDNVCALPQVTNRCRIPIPRFYFNTESRKCEQFTLGDCGGNGNNFETIDDCRRRCPEEEEEDKVTQCSLKEAIGPCDAAMTRFYFDRRYGRCQEFLYGGCGGNSNNFASRTECERRCSDLPPCPVVRMAPPPPGCHYEDKQQPSGCWLPSAVCPPNSADALRVCSMKPATGTCQEKDHSYYYDRTMGRCGKFTYSGCGGNENRFSTLEACRERCRGVPQCPVAGMMPPKPGCKYEDEQMENGCFMPKEVCPRDNSAACRLPKKVGHCERAVPRFWYNARRATCERFIFGGCNANKNNFESLDDCRKYCNGVEECQPRRPGGPLPFGCTQVPEMDEQGCPQSNGPLHCTEGRCASPTACPNSCDRCVNNHDGRRDTFMRCERNSTCEENNPCALMLCQRDSVCKVTFGEGRCVRNGPTTDACARVRCGFNTRCVVDRNGRASCVPQCPPPPPGAAPPFGCRQSVVMDAQGCPQYGDMHCTEGRCASPTACPKPCDRCINDHDGSRDTVQRCERNSTCEANNPCAVMLCQRGSVCKVTFGEGSCVRGEPTIGACARVRCGFNTRCVEDENGRASCVPNTPVDPCIATTCIRGAICVNQNGRGVCVNSQDKPGSCPRSAGFGTCQEACSGDADCKGADKCCSNGCGHTCQAPVGADENPCAFTLCPVGSICQNVEGRGVCQRPDEKDGSCPSFPPRREGLLGLCGSLCKTDSECKGADKCCRNSCGGLVCQAPVEKEKPGTCPAVPVRPERLLGLCRSMCQSDSECKGADKCCRNSCGGLVCQAPAVVEKPGTCPPLRGRRRRQASIFRCQNDGDCDGAEKCCSMGAGQGCILPRIICPLRQIPAPPVGCEYDVTTGSDGCPDYRLRCSGNVSLSGSVETRG